MKHITVVTDSTAYLQEEWIEQYQVRVVPQKIHWGDVTLIASVPEYASPSLFIAAT